LAQRREMIDGEYGVNGRMAPSTAPLATSKERLPKERSALQISAENAVAMPPPGPTSFAFSPKNSRHLCFLSSSPPSRGKASPERKLCYVDLSAPTVGPRPRILPVLVPAESFRPPSPSERLRHERQRVHSSGGVTSFGFHPSNKILVPHRGGIHLQEGLHPHGGARGGVRSLYAPSPHDAIDPQLSPDGRWVAFVLERELHCLPSDAPLGTVPRRLTFDGEDGLGHGLADFIAQEEMERHRGFWWNGTSDGLAFVRVDERHVPKHRIVHHQDDSREATNNILSEPSYEDHRYPFAGKDNPISTLGFLRVDNDWTKNREKYHWQKVKWLPKPEQVNEYLARVSWLPDGSLGAQWQDRTQKLLLLQRVHGFNQGETLTHQILFQERSDVWINLHHMMRPLPLAISPQYYNHDNHNSTEPYPNFTCPRGSFSFLFASERTGFCHLYLYTYISNARGEPAKLVRALTAGDWVVESIVGVDIEKDLVYVTGTYDSPLERHLYAVPLLNNHKPDAIPPAPIRITNESGMHHLVMDHNCRYLVDSSSDLNRPITVKVYALHHPIPHQHNNFLFKKRNRNNNIPQNTLHLLFVLHDTATQNHYLHNNNTFQPPELLSFRTADDATQLHAALYRPDPKTHGPGPYPLVLSVYGGPHVQRVNRSHAQTNDMRAQRLRSLGFAVLKCDNRGSSRRGLRFEQCLHRRLGHAEVLDQVAAVRWLALQGIADPERVGIYGWSYGGYLAAMCLCRAPDVFKIAVAGAPVTSWDGYDTHYTERYMGTPQDNPDAYKHSAVLDHVPHMRGKLMIVHGLIDENVHFRHTTRLINRLIANNKDYDLLLFPEERHSPRRLRDRIYMEQRISDYFVRFLLPKKHPVKNKLVLRNHDDPAANGPFTDNGPPFVVAGHL